MAEQPYAGLNAALDGASDWGLTVSALGCVHRASAVLVAAGVADESAAVHHIVQKMLDYFSARWTEPQTEHKNVEEMRHGIALVRTLTQLNRMHEAAIRYVEMAGTLVHKLEAFPTVLLLLQPFFPLAWTEPHPDLTAEQVATLATDAACALLRVGEQEHALVLHGLALMKNIDSGNPIRAVANLANTATTLDGLNRLARADSALRLALELAGLYPNGRAMFVARISMVERLIDAGQETEAERLWALLDPRHSWDYAAQRSGQAEIVNAYFKLRTGRLSDRELISIERHARSTNSAALRRKVHRLRGNLAIQLEDWGVAARELDVAMRLARASEISDADTEAKLVLARAHIGQLTEAAAEANRLAAEDRAAHAPLALIWQTLGQSEKALMHARLAYRRAWADGEPHVRRYDLREAALLLYELGAPLPDLPAYNQASDPPLPWEAKVKATINNRRNIQGFN
ncbi:hypothetical protein [Nocardia sp. NRRL S-836]|uniref:hypothetical protein n=1 Tax=Nocardia sp. NRRL S-836 TaxID=1519492 RepID=UPI000B0E8F06|nr:hypothetical protein [Nocardia sp. NRRL S-836]